MLSREVQVYISHQVNLRNKVLSTTLNKDIAIFENTIRRDLQELFGIGRIIEITWGYTGAFLRSAIK